MNTIAELPAISVLLPVFFRHVSVTQSRLLREALESVVDQRYGGLLEILLVDDGSPTPIETLAHQLGPAARHVRWLRLYRNRGIVGALNAGIAAAKTPLIARIDADDLWLDGKLQAQVAQFIEDPDLTISATGMVRVDTRGAEIDRHVRPGDWSGILRFFVENGCPFPHGSIVADRRIYRALGGYPSSGTVRHCEDYALWGTWLRFFKPAMVEKALYSYRVSGGSVSSEHAAQQTAASQGVRHRFERLELAYVLPKVLPTLAEALGVSLFEAGLLAYTAWHFRPAMAIPEDAIVPLGAVLPDRVLTRTETAPSWRTVVEIPGEDNRKLISVRADSLGVLG
ncbi:glycosyltransferase [Rhizobium sp. P32RR-XVIII]|nr:glycosyltransferase [Rhizobium sp. P32RR-XVIII]